MDTNGKSVAGSQSIDRALMLLSLISTHGGKEVPMPVLTRETGLSRPTVRRILLALIRSGYVEQSPEGAYYPGPECLIAGTSAARRHTLLDVSMESLLRLADASGDSSFVSIRRGAHSVCLHREEGGFPIRTHVLQPGARHPLGVGAGAMAILSALSEEEAQEVIDATRDERAAQFPGFDDAFLLNELAIARDRGWSLNPGMYVANSWAIGVPVRGPSGTALGALSIAAIDSRMTPDRQPQLAEMLKSEAARIEARQPPNRPI
ncbi:IclR family transcriptional regulator [Antarctobacter sp.]|uniref:IclR family transcriptional regulator n=1 Tax=Antarctobacter sp. TaxID=1872577 RepID=UPI002B278A80|nr:IclR family transcriptional regulator [Antarctobacter sp.]